MTGQPVGAAGRDTWRALERAAMDRLGPSRVFRDWLEVLVTAHLSVTDNVRRRGARVRLDRLTGPYERRYLDLIRPYTSGTVPNRPVDFLARAWASCQTASAPDVDVLGELYMEHISHGHNGQYFTPMPVCQMMAAMTGADVKPPVGPEPLRVCDPACGSGRMLLAWAVRDPAAHLTGMDVSHECCLMTVLNLAMRGYRGAVYQGDTLAWQFTAAWAIAGGGVREIDPALAPPKPAQPQQADLLEAI